MFTSLRFTHFALFTGLLVGLTTGVAAHFSRTELSSALVSQAVTQVEPAGSKDKDTRAAYSPVSLDQFTQSGRSLTGQRPSAIVAQLFGATEGLSPLGLEQMEIRYAESGEAIALLAQTGRQDDSVNGVRYRVELQPQPSDIGSQWQVTWVGQQFKCQPQRGQQDWAIALCL
ncbi:MAG: hypothetical protein KME12_11555 [Trichocoleus desertorum ATA4-8-CV12]|jgi:hypothetical protein|nr:hypothetical protein [Trichocoleus desertorum ATA4-8-CV12]